MRGDCADVRIWDLLRRVLEQQGSRFILQFTTCNFCHPRSINVAADQPEPECRSRRVKTERGKCLENFLVQSKRPVRVEASCRQQNKRPWVTDRDRMVIPDEP